MAFCAYCGTQLAEVSYAPCPQCGNPSNGAPRGAAVPRAAAPSKGPQVLIIVLAAFFGLIFVIGILAAIAIPNLLTAQNRVKQKRTMAQLRILATACEQYASDNGQYPDSSTVQDLTPLLTPKYLERVVTQDEWMHDFRYECWTRERKCDGYAIASAGSDGVFEHESLQDYKPGTIRDFQQDLVFSNGNFVRYPEGTVTR